MITRLLSALVMVIILALPVALGPSWVLLAFAGVLVPWCVYELIKATVSKSAMILGYISMAGSLGFLWYSHQGNFLLLWLLMASVAVSIIIVGLYLFEKNMASGRDVAIALSTLVYPAGLFSFWVLLRGAPDGRFWMIYGMICTFIADGGAYFAGRFLGRRKLSPKLSPKKTVEGLLGGIAASIIFGVALGIGYPKLTEWITLFEPFIRNYPVWLFISLGAAVALLDLAGDLMASMFKREFGIKDFGNIIPGHGGVLDRMDGIIPVGAVLYIILSFMV